MRIKIKYLVILIIFVLIVTKCKSSSHEYYLSNPTNSEIKLVLDSKEYKLKPQTFEKVKLKTGKHNLKTHKGENVNFIVYYDSTGGIINPARESYLIFSEVYGSLTTNTGAMLRESELKIGKLGFEVVADVTNRLIIDKNLYKWDYNLGEKLPESVVVSKMEKHDSKKKIFTRKEFVEYIEEVSKRKLPAEARTAILNDKITVDGTIRNESIFNPCSTTLFTFFLSFFTTAWDNVGNITTDNDIANTPIGNKYNLLA